MVTNSESGQDHSGDLLLDCFGEDVGQHWDDIEFIHFCGQPFIESANPKTETQLILDLEVDSRGQDGYNRCYAVHRDEDIPEPVHL